MGGEAAGNCHAIARTAGRQQHCAHAFAEGTGMTKPELVVPDWVPASVAETGRELFRAASERRQEVIKRLLTDDRMKRVWPYLMRDNREPRWPKAEERPARSIEILKAACNTSVAAFYKAEIEDFQNAALQA